jgi:membrane associated rhomboid family serine protease
MIPIRDVIPTRTTAFVVFAFIAANAAMLTFALVVLRPTTGFVVYLAVNALFMWLFGENVEDRTGHGRFVALLIVSGSAAAITRMAGGYADAGLVAAGGATAGTMGAYFTLFPRSLIVTLVPLIITVKVVEIPAMYLLPAWFVFQWSAGTLAAHLVAFAVGLLGGVALRRPERLSVEWWVGIR